MFQIDQDECVNGKKNSNNSVGYYSPRKIMTERLISIGQNNILLSPPNYARAIAT